MVQTTNRLETQRSMNDQLHVVNLETCNGDGICAEVCPENALELLNEKAATVESRAGSCIYCGQCVAVCPTESLQMPKLEMEDFRRLHKRPFGYDEFHEFLRLRRSVRVFKDQPIERHVIEKVLEAAATAPMGFPPHTTEVVVIDDRSKGLRERYGIPRENRVLTSLIFGHPKYKYRQGIRRKLAGVTYH